jgi:hypothetical protein
MKLKQLVKAVESGKEIEIKTIAGKWETTQPADINDALSKFRVKPEQLNPVDLSVLIKSGIDCEFWDVHGATQIQTLGSIATGIISQTYFTKSKMKFIYCRPRLNHIHA